MKRKGAVLFCWLLISACTVGPDFVKPDAPREGRYTRGAEPVETSAVDGKTQRFDATRDVQAHWWNLFKSDALDKAMDQALAGNQTRQAAIAALKQSQENLRAGYGVYYPQINASFTGANQKVTPQAYGVNAPSSIFNIFTLTGSISYMLDIFGEQRRTVEALKAQVDAQRFATMATYLSLTGNVVNAVIARAAYQEQIEATQALINSQKEQVSITEAQVRAGTTPTATLLALQSQLYNTEATLPPLEQKLNQTEHLLALLSGETPAQWTEIQVKLNDLNLPDSLPKSLPSKLVRQRPDILQSEALLHVSSAQVGVATAALFPSFNLTGSGGALNTSPGGLFSGNSSIWNLGGNITAPIFHGGTLRAQKRAAVAAFQSSLANYKQTVLAAFSQVADTLRSLEHDAQLVQTSHQALDASLNALKLIQSNYAAGTANYVQVLIANAQYHQAQIVYLQGRAQRFQDTVALFVALGGGWWNETNLGF